ncbi:hypothetical protein DYB25_004424 [Aphanomyces astaci]|uniref:Uncharacterized protein n=1 Tax=Aphanomyces astaci TaxID=112090 RepID=A0A397F596_APHAT|nr:hypothetical protein DYB25_004424 [Aphanomyces astaci]RHY21001.1 hypothetical protein DYB36_011604 [Aphanomyces astaci]RHY39578.1 hypothetical protein DYB30_011744 [Aphanomyces astaci]RHY50494.1 hypothetical protein DYB38_009379 [Aphanomyces astaci]RHY79362.1 hypothetical protein DYB26_010297 [Aphanomyces astaci]
MLMVGWVVLLLQGVGMAWAASEAMFPSVDDVVNWNAAHAAVLPPEVHPPVDDAAWLSCMLCRSTATYIDQVRRLPVSCPTLIGGVDLTCKWLARNKSSPACHNLTDNTMAIKESLQRGDSVGKICHYQLPMCRKHDVPARLQPTIEPSDAMLGGYHPKCMQCWVAVHYVNATRRHRDLPVKAVQIGTQIVCERGRPHRDGCRGLTHHVPAILAGLKNGSTTMTLCRRMHYCPGHGPHHDIPPHAIAPPRYYPTPEPNRDSNTAMEEQMAPPKVETAVGTGIGLACAIMALVALLYCAFAKPYHVDPTSAYLAVPHEE